jgi:hypothetical protein
MKTYSVFSHPLYSSQAVKHGFSWPGFLFTWIWAFVKGLPGKAVLILCVGMVAYGLDVAAGGQTMFSSVVILVMCLFVGLMGNEWRASNLDARGYTRHAPVDARSPDHALSLVRTGGQERAFDERPTHAAQAARRPCPWCAEPIQPAARLCRYCQRDVEPMISV